MKKYTNRYGDVFTFEQLKNGNIQWSGNFKYCRFGMPNDYSKAWEKYQEEYGGLDYEEFVGAIHTYDEESNSYVFADLLPLVKSKKGVINMVDPSGGPYLSTHTNLGERFGEEELKGLCISSFEPIETGYKLHTYGEFDHLDD